MNDAFIHNMQEKADQLNELLLHRLKEVVEGRADIEIKYTTITWAKGERPKLTIEGSRG
jgi:hypothetical protein